ncbi:MAG: cupin domain-containing protein [Chitinivibrionales bacterium]|nr:cupin domain-containing protein [Chitinivibrionales bacterium]
MRDQIIAAESSTRAIVLPDDGIYPNNEQLPLLVYENVLPLSGDEPASQALEHFERNGWGDGWVNGMYTFQHYHSTAHEAIAVVQGSARIQLGGPEKGITLYVGRGDVVVIPAGVAHRKLDSTGDFAVVGAYPPGQHYDMQYGKPGERPQADERIRRVELPQTDPVFGHEGPLKSHWHGHPPRG